MPDDMAQEFYGWHAERGHAPQWEGGGVFCETCGERSAAERWRPVPGHKGYEASSLGRVRSVPRTLINGRAVGGTVLAQQPDKDGYPTVKLRGKRVRVARVVQLAFAGPAEVRHLDGDRSNSRPENLAWGSRVENEQDKRKGKEGDRWERWARPFPLETPETREPC